MLLFLNEFKVADISHIGNTNFRVDPKNVRIQRKEKKVYFWWSGEL